MDPVVDGIDDFDATPVLLSPASAEALVVSAWEAHHAEIYAFVARAVRDDAAAEDLVQETFLRLTVEARRGRAPEQMRAWLFRVATNLVISRGRRRSTAVRWLTRHGADEYRSRVVGSPESGLIEAEKVREAQRAIGLLSADARVALLLSSSGFSGAEIAAAIGRSDAATRTLLTRARIAVRRQLATGETA